GGTAPYSYAITAGALPAGLTLASNGTLSGTPTAGGSFNFTVTATDASTGSGPYTGSRSYTLTIINSNTTVVSVTRLDLSPTATAQVSYRVVFANSVSGLTVSNFTTANGGTTVTGSSVSSVSGSGTTYTVVVNTGTSTSNGTLRLDVQNTTGISPTVTNVPYTAGEVYTITKSFAAAPTLRIQAAGSASGNGDVTAFVDVVQVLQSGTSTVVANGLQNGSFESNNVASSNFKKTADGVVAAPWAFTGLAGVSRNGSAFGSTAADGDAVGLVQSAGDNNASISQNLAVPTGSYQVNFQARQRNYTSKDQRLNVFVNDVFVGNIQPNGNTPPTYDTFTSATFNVTAPALTATVSTTSGSPTSTSPIPFRVDFSQSVGASFTASDVTVTGGTLNSGSFAGSGAGPYTFTVTPSGTGTVTVSLAANVANDANNTGNSASNAVSVQFQAPTITVGPASLPNGTQGTAYSQTLTASGGTAPYTYAITAGALPSGLSLTAGGTLAGTPTVNGSFTFTVTATDASVAPGPYTGSRSYTLVVNTQPVTAAPVITAPTNNSFTNQSVNFVGTAPANSQVVFYISQNGGAFQPSPSFLVSATGNFSAGPFAFSDGTYQVYATAQSPGATVSPNSPTINFTVDTTRPSVVITSSAGASGGSTATTPIPFSVTFSETVNGSFVQGDLSVSGGTIVTGSFGGSGAGPYTFTVTPSGIGSVVSVNVVANVAQDAAGNFNTAAPAAYTLLYAPALTATVSTTSGSPTSTSPIPFRVDFSQSVGASFTASDVTVTGGTLNAASFAGSGAGPYTFTVTPSGTGTVTVSLAANVANDAANTGNQASNAVSVQFQAPTITVGPASLPNGTQGTAYSQTLTASGGTAPYTYAITAGALPSGLSLTNGTLAGTPTVNGSFTFTVTATDASVAPGPYTGSRSYTLAIAAPVVTAVVWNGNVSTDWFNANNWSPNVVPDATIDAVIPTAPSGNRFPVIAANASSANARNVSIASGASLSMSANTLTIAANLTNNGAFNGFTGSSSTATGGTVVLGNTALSSVLGGGSTRFWNLTVGASTAQLSTSAGASVLRLLALNGNLATNANPFTLVSDAAGTAMVVNNGGSVVSGNVTVQRYIDPSLNPNRGYRHVSAAISNATVGSLATSGFTPVVNPAYNTSPTPLLTVPFPTVYGYDQSRLATTNNNVNAFDKGWYSPNATSDPLAVGQGYTVLIGGGQTWNFTGPLNNGNVTVNLARNSGATAADAGYALIGNPYPSPLDWGQVQDADRPNVGRTMYVYRSNDPGNPYTGVYGFYNNGIGTISPVIAQGQGFFVRVADTQTAGSVTFKNSHRPTTYSSPTYQRTTETRPLVELNLQGAGSTLTDAAFVYFEQGATDAFDGQFDAEKLANPSGLNLSTSLSATQRLAIDGRAPLGTTQRVVPLAVGVPAVGSYTLTAAQLLNLGNTPVYLRDLQSGAVVDLRAQSSYTFTVSNASALLTGRFELVFSPQAPLATAPAALAAQVGLYPNPATTTAFVELPAALGRTAVAAELVDALGRTVRTQQLPAQGAAPHRLNLAELAAGVYTLHLKTSAGVVVKKLVVE
ncbi:putative Ig domain-containing protein, partial [Hymenobacter sp. M29]